MLIFTIIVLLIVIFATVYIFLIMPRVSDRADMDLQSTDYAHRGLHSAAIPENSLAAFALARDAGYGIELDIRLSADGEIFVFHDENIKRMCQKSAVIHKMTSAEIRSLYLKGTDERIPTLSEALELIDGRVPILIEVKSAPNEYALCRAVCELLDGYQGAFAMQSFSPKVLSYFKKYRPRFARGQLVTKIDKQSKEVKSPILRFALTHMLLNTLSRPDFISIDGKLLREPAFFIITRLFAAKGFVWTVRKPEQYRFCKNQGLFTIFEHIHPQ